MADWESSRKARQSAAVEPLDAWARLASVTRAAFFFSGLSALFYQTIWLRQLSTVFGNTTLAISVTLTAFMAGLALGSWLLGRRGDRVARPFRLYAWLEILIGLYGLGSLTFLQGVHTGYVALARRLPFDSPALVSFQFWACFLVLLVPTALMGGTLPIAVKGFVRRLESVSEEVGRLYGLNTFGAALGVLLAGFILLPIVGLKGAVILAAAVNLAVGAAVLLAEARTPAGEPDSPRDANPAGGDGSARRYRRRRRGLPRNANPAGGDGSAPSRRRDGRPLSRPLRGVLFAGFLLSGFSGLALEVVWVRAFALYVGCSVYVFSAVLLAVLLGIAVGSILVARLARAHQISLHWFAGAQLGAGLSCLALVLFYTPLAFVFLQLVSNYKDSYSTLLFVEVLTIVGCLLLPTLFSGASFPILSRVIVSEEKRLSRGIGALYAANTLGCILGAFSAGFLLIPHLGLRATALLCAAFYIVSAAAVLFWGAGRSRLAGAVSLAALAGALFLLPPWRADLMTAGFYRGFVNAEQAKSAFAQKKEVLFYREGILATVSVNEGTNGGRFLAINGKPDASDLPLDMETQLLLAHIPLLLATRQDSILVVGLGSGVSAGAAGLHPTHRIDCVEIEPAVVEAAHYFLHVNRNIFADPRFHLIQADARNYLAATPRRYDVIVSEPSNPWLAGVASLFTVEHFQALRDRLSDDGVIAQWLQTYQMGSEDIACVVASFTKVFPHSTAWWASRSIGNSAGDILLIAQKHPWKPDFPLLSSRILRSPQIQEDLRRTPFASPAALLSAVVLGPADLKRLASRGKVNTDNLPVLEFSAPQKIYLRTSNEENAVTLSSVKSQPLEEVVHLGPAGRDADTRMALARAFEECYPEGIQKLLYLGWMRHEITTALSLAPYRPDLYEEAARLEIPLGEISSARLHLQKALALKPDNKGAAAMLAALPPSP